MSKSHVTHISAASVAFVFGVVLSAVGMQLLAPTPLVSPALASSVAVERHVEQRYFDRTMLEIGSVGNQTYSHVALGR